MRVAETAVYPGGMYPPDDDDVDDDDDKKDEQDEVSKIASKMNDL